jgi:hypothetical protein
MFFNQSSDGSVICNVFEVMFNIVVQPGNLPIYWLNGWVAYAFNQKADAWV